MLMANKIGSNISQVVSKAGILEGECPFFVPFLQLNCQGGNVAVSLFCLLKGLGHSLHLDRRRKDVKAHTGQLLSGAGMKVNLDLQSTRRLGLMRLSHSKQVNLPPQRGVQTEHSTCHSLSL